MILGEHQKSLKIASFKESDPVHWFYVRLVSQSLFDTWRTLSCCSIQACNIKYDLEIARDFFAPSGAQWVAISVRLSVCHGDKLSRALNLHLSSSGLSEVNLRSLSGLSHFMRSLLLSLSLLRMKERLSLKYFVLLYCSLLFTGVKRYNLDCLI